MSFISWAYVVFLPVVCCLHFNLPVRYRWLGLLIASTLFYVWLIPSYIVVIAGLIAWDFVLGLRIEASRGPIRTLYLLLSLAGNLGILCLFKYGPQLSSVGFSLIMPLGLSFHVFQSLSYTIDVYQGRCRAERHWGYYALFVMVFFQMVAGPIERAGRLLPQLHAARCFDARRASLGLRTIAWGFFQKMVIADRAGEFVNAVYSRPGSFSGTAMLLATFLFSIQIYCDFAGYSNIARGSALLLNIDILANFRRPYTADSLSAFWRSWHISLSNWFRDYIYMPLGGSQTSSLLWARNILVVFLLSGGWHGASWTFVLWGAYHGLCLIAARGFGKAWPKLASSKTRIVRWGRIGLTFGVVTIGWVFFRASSIPMVRYIFKKILFDIPRMHSLGTWAAALKSFTVPGAQWVLMFVGLLVLWFVEARRPDAGWESWFSSRPGWFRFSAYYGALTIFMVMAHTSMQPFIYFQF